MTTLVVDTGQDLVGIYSVTGRRFTAYRGAAIIRALRRLQAADEVVTCNGKNHDLEKLAGFAGLVGDLPLNGIHSDIRSVCWSDRIWGMNLARTYAMHHSWCPDFPDTHEGSCRADVYMTLKLWQLWKLGQLKVIDGNIL